MWPGAVHTAGAGVVSCRRPLTYSDSVAASASYTPVSRYHWPATGSNVADGNAGAPTGASPGSLTNANRRVSSRNWK